MQRLILRHGDCVDVLRGYEDGSIGAVISDPPYGLKFMGKAFDDLGEGASQRKWHEAWLTEAFRVLRPGGVIKAFNGTRTFHHMAYAMQEAGFIDLQVVSWNYGSGFPKSTNIGKKLAQYEAAQASDPFWLESDTDVAKGSERFRNWGTALKPAWEPVVIGRKPE